MRKATQLAGAVCLLVASVTGMTASVLAAPPPERYLHVKVEDAKEGESVNVNLPLSIAEKILPTVNKGDLREGHVTISKPDLDGIDVKGLLDAIRTAPDNEFVTVKQKDQDIRIAKSNGNLIVHVRCTDTGTSKTSTSPFPSKWSMRCSPPPKTTNSISWPRCMNSATRATRCWSPCRTRRSMCACGSIPRAAQINSDHAQEESR